MSWTAWNASVKRIVVEYDADGGRKSETFTEAGKAKRFYTKKMNEGKRPKIIKAER